MKNKKKKQGINIDNSKDPKIKKNTMQKYTKIKRRTRSPRGLYRTSKEVLGMKQKKYENQSQMGKDLSEAQRKITLDIEATKDKNKRRIKERKN